MHRAFLAPNRLRVGMTVQSGAALTFNNTTQNLASIAGGGTINLGSGISANVDAMARIGYLYLQRGEWHGVRLLPRAQRAGQGVAS